MNLLAWREKKCVVVPEEFWREDKFGVIAYMQANLNKIYLLSDVQELFNVESSIRFAREVEFPSSVKLISSLGEFTVESLSDVLEHITYDENFIPTAKSFLVVTENFFDVANEVRRQCSILQVPLEICSEEEFSAIATEQKLIDNATSLLRELDGVKNLCDKKSKLKLRENISLVEEFLAATEKLERYLKSFDAPIRIGITGEQKERETLAEIFGRLNFETETLAGVEVAQNLPNYSVCVCAVNALNFSQAESHLQTLAESPDKDRIIFVVIRPALREQETEINSTQILFDFARTLDAKGFNDAPIFFLDAPEIFTPLLANVDESLTLDSLTESFGLTGRERFLTRLSLEKFFDALPNPSNKSLLQKTGIPYLENYLRHSLQKNPLPTENLLCQVERAISFVDDDALKNLRLNELKKLSAAANQTEFLREKISLIAMQEKTVSGNAIAKALIYDVDNAINNFLRAIEMVICETFDELTASEEFCAEKLVALYQGKISVELKNLLATTEESLQAACDEQSRKLIGLTRNIIDEHRTQAKEFIDFVCSTAGNLSDAPELPEVNSFDVPPFDAGLHETFSSENLSKLVKRCTRILCIQEVYSDWSFFKANRKQLLKNFHLSGTFRRELRQRLDELAQDKVNALGKNLRQKFFTATLEYFKQVSKLCRAQRELCLNIFRQNAMDIYNKIDFLNQDFVIMEEISFALKGFRETWRLICPKQNLQSLSDENSSDDSLKAILERKNQLLNISLTDDDLNDLSAEKFLPVEMGAPHKNSNENADFSSGKKAFLSKKNEVALKSFSQAAAMGNVDAIKYLAYMHQNGIGTPKDIYAAIENYLDAFCLGDNDSVSELGEIFSSLKCYSRALEWYQMAADNGDKYIIELMN